MPMSIDERDREILEQFKEQERAGRVSTKGTDMDSSAALVALFGLIVVLCRVVALIAVGAGVLQLFWAMNAFSAPQQTAGAVMALAITVIPFVLVRVLEGFKR